MLRLRLFISISCSPDLLTHTVAPEERGAQISDSLLRHEAVTFTGLRLCHFVRNQRVIATVPSE